MLGPKSRPADGDALALEQRLASELGLDEQAVAALGRLAPGTRRDLFAPLTDLSVEAVTERPEPALRLTFTLPAGGYATEVIRQLTHTPFLERNEGKAAPEPESTDDD
jgi:tRNA(Glu) U13 pseudouridine synthase TruD